VSLFKPAAFGARSLRDDLGARRALRGNSIDNDSAAFAGDEREKRGDEPRKAGRVRRLGRLIERGRLYVQASIQGLVVASTVEPSESPIPTSVRWSATAFPSFRA